MWFFKKHNSTSTTDKIKSDEDLFDEFKKTGNQELFADLFKKHAKSVYGTCLFYLQDKVEAQDATMQLFEKLLLEKNNQNIQNFKGWLSFVVRNHCISIIRKNKTHLKQQQQFYEFEYAIPNVEDEESIGRVGEERLLEQMKNCLPKLKEAQRLCVELFYLKQQTYQQIVEQTTFSLNEVKSHIQNGKRNLKLLIDQQK